MGKPSLGSWVGYGLGSEYQDLPAFVVLPDPAGGIKGGPPAYGAGFLPATHQGTAMRSGPKPILDFAGMSVPSTADALRWLDEEPARGRRMLLASSHGTGGYRELLDASSPQYQNLRELRTRGVVIGMTPDQPNEPNAPVFGGMKGCQLAVLT